MLSVGLGDDFFSLPLGRGGLVLGIRLFCFIVFFVKFKYILLAKKSIVF